MLSAFLGQKRADGAESCTLTMFTDWIWRERNCIVEAVEEYSSKSKSSTDIMYRWLNMACRCSHMKQWWVWDLWDSVNAVKWKQHSVCCDVLYICHLNIVTTSFFISIQLQVIYNPYFSNIVIFSACVAEHEQDFKYKLPSSNRPGVTISHVLLVDGAHRAHCTYCTLQPCNNALQHTV